MALGLHADATPPTPQQPLVKDARGVVRFQANDIIVWMLAQGRVGARFDLNSISMQPFAPEDMIQLLQLIGYSVSGIGDMDFIPSEIIEHYDTQAGRLLQHEPEHYARCETCGGTGSVQK